VHACDRYQLLYRGFEQFFNQYWDFGINCNCYFATEELDVKIDGFKNIKSGTGEWSDRLRHLLIHEISEEYVIYIQEDVWLSEPVSAAFFNGLFEIAFKHHYKQVKLHSVDLYRTIETDQYLCGFNVAKVDNAHSKYLMSHQVTLWERNFLLSNLKPNEHPWRNERRATKRMKRTNPDIYHIDYFAQNFSSEINKNLPERKRSCFHPVSINSTLDEQFMLFVDKFQLEKPGDEAYLNKLIYHYQNGLTHDGNPKPRKDDIFKRIKLFVLRLFS
jgi:hypothetical protein